ncbi:MAG: HisA/HisF-related TIM barrel protein, partial [Vulcanimicrobiaceae bacterium]
KRVIFTEIRRDGTGQGFDIDGLRAVANAAPIAITASGGASTLEDLERLRREAPPSVDSCVVGRALYEGTMELAEAIAAVA